MTTEVQVQVSNDPEILGVAKELSQKRHDDIKQKFGPKGALVSDIISALARMNGAVAAMLPDDDSRTALIGVIISATCMEVCRMAGKVSEMSDANLSGILTLTMAALAEQDKKLAETFSKSEGSEVARAAAEAAQAVKH
jgi:hypothetical protein